jgi:hypothetical protein
MDWFMKQIEENREKAELTWMAKKDLQFICGVVHNHRLEQLEVDQLGRLTEATRQLRALIEAFAEEDRCPRALGA